MTPSEYKKLKGLKRENLRDHMDDLELIFNMLGEASTTKIARKKCPYFYLKRIQSYAQLKITKTFEDYQKYLEVGIP